MDVRTVAGYLGGLAAGAAGIVAGVMQEEVGFIIIGVAFLVAVAIAFTVRATATPKITRSSVGGKFMELPDGALYTVGGVLLVGFVLGGIIIAT